MTIRAGRGVTSWSRTRQGPRHQHLEGGGEPNLREMLKTRRRAWALTRLWAAARWGKADGRAEQLGDLVEGQVAVGSRHPCAVATTSLSRPTCRRALSTE